MPAARRSQWRTQTDRLTVTVVFAGSTCDRAEIAARPGGGGGSWLWRALGFGGEAMAAAAAAAVAEVPAVAAKAVGGEGGGVARVGWPFPGATVGCPPVMG